jgi:hypothetical protein
MLTQDQERTSQSGFAKVSYDAAVAANNRLGNKFDRAVSSSPDTSRTA